ncbi:hypothetical protein ACKC9G_12840 [Pokkaliibacter sp. CJK22405]|uniref:hypothetical protein n=1 Tax=Pokkaliibacter sp. CJK22405 TaxID=3384615 RepID=UPI0039846442
MEQLEIREGARRQHRGLAMFCVLYCWHHNKNAVFLRKELLLRYLGLERMKTTRYEWIIEDITDYFPYIFKRNKNNNELIVFSKIPESELLENKNEAIHFFPKILDLANYSIIGLDADGDQAYKFIEDSMPFLSGIKNLHEFAINNALSLLSNGIVQPAKVLESRLIKK